MPVANRYYELTQNPLLADTFAQFTAVNYIFRYLPIWVTIIGIIGGILLMINLISGRNNLNVGDPFG